MEETPLETRQRYPVGERETQVSPDQKLATGSAAEPKNECRKVLFEADGRQKHRPLHPVALRKVFAAADRVHSGSKVLRTI